MKPWLWLPAEWSSALAPLGLTVVSELMPVTKNEWRPLKWRHLYFRNRAGIAGGVDKDAELLRPWWKLGAGFIEVGTVTPQPQTPNPGKIQQRINSEFALWNRMGFPSAGAEFVLQNLLSLPTPRPTPVFVNIGKNRATPNEEAHQDYCNLIEKFSSVADAFVINISSPNTKDLRALFTPELFTSFLRPLIETRQKVCTQTPLLLKLSPDLSDQDLRTVLRTSCECGIDGFILTNTTLTRPQSAQLPSEGGLSGKPLQILAKENLRKTIEFLGSDRENKLLISVGGILTAQDIDERLQMGADLVETYSGLVFEGPHFFQKAAHYFLAKN